MTAETPEGRSAVVRRDWEAIIGREHVGTWFTIGADRVASFEHASHLDQDGPDGPYPEGLVEGFHLLALLDHFGGQVIPLGAPGHLGWNYGLDRVRFITPVHVGDRLRLRATVVDVRERRRDAFLVTVAYVAELDGAARPAFTAQMLAFQQLLAQATATPTPTPHSTP